MSRTKKYSVRWYQKLLDKELSGLITSIGYCQKCGGTQGLSCSHVIPRTNHFLRWNPINLLCLDFRCHIMWWHKNPLEASAWFAEKFPERLVYLEENKNTIKKRTIDDYKKMLKAVEDRDIKKLITY